MNSEIDQQLSMALGTPFNMDEQISYMIFGSVATTTKAFGDVKLNVNANICIVFVEVTLRWWARHKRFQFLQDYWLKKAEQRALEFLPNRWRLVIHYGKRNSKPDTGSEGSPGESLPDDNG